MMWAEASFYSVAAICVAAVLITILVVAIRD